MRSEQQHVRSRALVTQVPRTLQSLPVRLPRAFDRVRPPPVDGRHPEGLSENAPVARGVLHGKCPSGVSAALLLSEERLGKELRAQRLRGQSFVAELQTRAEPRARRARQPPRAALACRKRHVATPSWATASVSRSSPASSIACRKSSVASSCAWYERTRASRMSARARLLPGPEVRDHCLELCLRPQRVARLVVQIGGVDGAPVHVLRPIDRGQLARAVEQKRRRSRSASGTGVARRVLENRRHVFVGLARTDAASCHARASGSSSSSASRA